ncbi:DNA-binding protein [Achromobacter seleniivolatilans]|uniref:DNA-binding protein n=1 Tax=Achromobacter seleniivolatilans TaxID=3047478 RepID=UPI0035285A8F
MKKNTASPATSRRSPSRDLAWFRANGVTISSWCRQEGLSYHVVRELLYGRNKGIRGESHRAAIALGIKPDPKTLDKEDSK